MYSIVLFFQESVNGEVKYSPSPKVYADAPDVSILEAILHTMYRRCLYDERVVELNGAERNSEWAKTFDPHEYFSEEDFDADGNYIGIEEYLLYGWRDAPIEFNGFLSYTEIAGDKVHKVMLRIYVTEDTQEGKEC